MKPVLLIPTWNEADNIGELLEVARSYVRDIYLDDGGSTDGTQTIARRAGATVLDRPQGVGPLGWLLTTPYLSLLGDATHVVTMDAGGSHDPDYLMDFRWSLEWRPRELLLGWRHLKYAAPRTLLSKLGAGLLGVPDATCGFRSYPMHLLKKLPRMQNSTGFTFHFVALGLLLKHQPQIRWISIPYKLVGRTSLDKRTIVLAARAYLELRLGRVPTC